MTFRQFYRAYSLALLVFALTLMAMCAAAVAGDNLFVRACPTDEALEDGTDPQCELKSAFLGDDGVCGAILADLDAGRADALAAALPETAKKYARFAKWPADAWCVSAAVRFMVPDIAAPGG